MTDTRISVTKNVASSPAELFAVLAKPSRHPEFDSTGTLQSTETESVTQVGDEFVMKMRNDVLSDYEIRNRITEFEPDRKITWAPSLHPLDGYTDKLGGMQATGHSFSWELTPVDAGTEVTQVYDWTGVADQQFAAIFPGVSAAELEESIDRLGRL